MSELNSGFTLEEIPCLYQWPSPAKQGDIVKIGITSDQLTEWIWVLVKRVDCDQFYGVFDNTPLAKNVKLGDPVVFKQEHVLRIWQDH